MLMPAPRRTSIAYVAGAGGFIGRHVTAALKKAGWTVVGFGSRRPLQDDLGLACPDHWVEGPIQTEPMIEALTIADPPELIINAAGSASISASFADPRMDFDRTVGGTAAILEFVRHSRSEARLIFLSSAAVYGSAAVGPISEGNALSPISPYGVHKEMAENLVIGWSRLFGIDSSIIRLFSIYGPGIRKQLLWELVGRLTAKPPSLEFGGDGSETRDFLHVDDVTRLIGLVAAAPRQHSVRLLNGGSGQGIAIRDIIMLVSAEMGSHTEISFNNVVRSGDPHSLVADITKAREIGFSAEVSLKDGIHGFTKWAQAALRNKAR